MARFSPFFLAITVVCGGCIGIAETNSDTHDASGDEETDASDSDGDPGNGDTGNGDTGNGDPGSGDSDPWQPDPTDEDPIVVTPDIPITGERGVWQQADLPDFNGEWCASLMVDPVNLAHIYVPCGNNSGTAIKWYRSEDYGESWTLTNSTAMHGDPWGASIDPNTSRNPSTRPTIYSPAGYGVCGIWKSTDGAETWTRLASADTAYAPYNPQCTDVYHTAILPDDPPNHVLVTYHYGFKNNGANEGGFGETWDGGATWVIHPPTSGIGSSHYVLPMSGTTWVVVSQETSRGTWRTTTAGRVGGTAENKFRDGTISTTAWTKVSNHSHIHGSYTSVKIGNTWYSPGETSSESTIHKSSDGGATWTNVLPGYYWPSPPNPDFSNKNIWALAATERYIYGAANLEISRTPIDPDTGWVRNYVTTPDAIKSTSPGPFGMGVTHDGDDNWMVFMALYSHGVWRFVEEE